MSARRGARVRCAARAPAVPRRVPFVYDNNNGTHSNAKRTRWVVPTRRRRADLSDRGGGRRVVGRTIPRGGRATVEGRACVTRGGTCGGERTAFHLWGKKTTIIVFLVEKSQTGVHDLKLETVWPVRFVSSKSRLYLLKDRDQVGLSAGRTVGLFNGPF